MFQIIQWLSGKTWASSQNSQKGDKDCQDDETHVLIELLAKHEYLFNPKHPQYLKKKKKNSRAKAIDKITEKSKEENFDEIDAKQVQEKLTKLRNYYDAQRGKEENFKVSGSGTDSLYVSSWRFYKSLHYLKVTLTPPETVSNIDGEYDEDDVYQINKSCIRKSCAKN